MASGCLLLDCLEASSPVFGNLDALCTSVFHHIPGLKSFQKGSFVFFLIDNSRLVLWSPE